MRPGRMKRYNSLLCKQRSATTAIKFAAAVNVVVVAISSLNYDFMSGWVPERSTAGYYAKLNYLNAFSLAFRPHDRH